MPGGATSAAARKSAELPEAARRLPEMARIRSVISSPGSRNAATCFTFPSHMKNSKSTLLGCLAALLFAFAFAPEAHAEERMNGMVGLFYSSYDLVGFEYDLIAQFQKSQDWHGNITGFYVSDEIFPHANRCGLGFVLGQRAVDKGTFAASVTGFGENRFSRFSRIDWGGEGKITIAIFGVKVGIINKEKIYVEAGLSY
jgi:hypothetical protein